MKNLGHSVVLRVATFCAEALSLGEGISECGKKKKKSKSAQTFLSCNKVTQLQTGGVIVEVIHGRSVQHMLKPTALCCFSAIQSCLS